MLLPSARDAAADAEGRWHRLEYRTFARLASKAAGQLKPTDSLAHGQTLLVRLASIDAILGFHAWCKPGEGPGSAGSLHAQTSLDKRQPPTFLRVSLDRLSPGQPRCRQRRTLALPRRYHLPSPHQSITDRSGGESLSYRLPCL